jgi:hypothetical protein
MGFHNHGTLGTCNHHDGMELLCPVKHHIFAKKDSNNKPARFTTKAFAEAKSTPFFHDIVSSAHTGLSKLVGEVLACKTLTQYPA